MNIDKSSNRKHIPLFAKLALIIFPTCFVLMLLLCSYFLSYTRDYIEKQSSQLMKNVLLQTLSYSQSKIEQSNRMADVIYLRKH